MISLNTQSTTDKNEKRSDKMKTADQDLETRIVKIFTDIIILKYLKNNPLTSGYQILRHLHAQFGILFSPGTVYQEIYRLERKCLINGINEDNARTYCLTTKGEKTLLFAAKSSNQISGLVSSILSPLT
jgi:DNA-binding PadR family transcriptional regulator